MPLGVSEFEVGEKLGLHSDLSLPQACANFYILESLQNDLFPWDGDVRIPKGVFPVSFGQDTEIERRAYSVQKSLQDMEAKLADEFALYLRIACGGELRHIAQRRTRIEIKRGPCAHKHTRKCCNHKDDHTYCYKTFCPCDCSHRHETTCDYYTVKCGCVCCHSCKVGTKCIKVLGPYTPPPRIEKFLSSCREDDFKRAGSWDTWYNLSNRHPVPWMRDCAKALSSSIWDEGVSLNGKIIKDSSFQYGGPSWATAALLTADYYAGTIKARTFIDRCWSLQHNTGCIFNKFYNVNALSEILLYQADNNYDLLSRSANQYVSGLWKSHNRERLAQLPTTCSSTVSESEYKEPVSDPLLWLNEGCAACYDHYETTGAVDSCLAYSGSDSQEFANDECYYYDH